MNTPLQNMHDENMKFIEPKKEKGLFKKYTVINNQTGKEIEGLAFILRPEKDDAALVALETYAESIENETLKQDLKEWVKYLKWERGNA